ncbi:hypothetical protein BKA80DRAFT_267354 [Phyllosticta citrichinensis]
MSRLYGALRNAFHTPLWQQVALLLAGYRQQPVAQDASLRRLLVTRARWSGGADGEPCCLLECPTGPSPCALCS